MLLELYVWLREGESGFKGGKLRMLCPEKKKLLDWVSLLCRIVCACDKVFECVCVMCRNVLRLCV